MNAKLFAAVAALAALTPLTAAAQDEWASKQQAGWQAAQPQDGSSAALVSRSVMIDEGNTPIVSGTPGRSEQSNSVQDNADDVRNRPMRETAGLYFGG